MLHGKPHFSFQILPVSEVSGLPSLDGLTEPHCWNRIEASSAHLTTSICSLKTVQSESEPPSVSIAANIN